MENRKECHPELRAVVVNRRMENMEQFLRVGVISSTHGIRGEVKYIPRPMIRNVFWILMK